MKHEIERPVARGVAGGPFGDRSAVAVVGESRADVAREALKIARVESQSRPVLLVDLLGQGSALDEMFGDDDPHGVSDSARYGVSLARVARPVPNADGLFVISGGAETPQADDVLSDHLWGSWSDQCRRAGALLVVAAPADLADVGKAIDQLDGMVMIGDAVAPRTQAPLIGRVPAARRRTITDVSSPRRITPAEIEAVRRVTPRRSRKLMIAGGVAALAVVAVAGTWWATSSIRTPATPTPSAAGSQPIVMPGDRVIDAPAVLAAATDVAGAAPWSVEIASVNSMAGAMARVRQARDSFPVPTFAASRPGGGSATWYRLLAGAFATTEQADSLLVILRARGVLGPAAGRVVKAPLAWQLEEGVPDDQLPTRLFAWRQQGLPAYALIDVSGNNRVYFGAFGTEDEARLLSPVLDSLNLSATLATRVGSIR
jgi:hypothetical protein